MAGSNASAAFGDAAMMTPIATPITMSGFSDDAVKEFGPIFNQLGLTVPQGGAGGNLDSSKPAKDWATVAAAGRKHSRGSGFG